MRKGGSKAKGALFEREVCKRLSQWVSAGHADDLFWRSAMSGGRATIGRQRGLKVSRQPGDITAVAPEGHTLTDRFYIECKFVSDLKLDRFVIGVGAAWQYWARCSQEARYHGKHPMLIARQNRFETFLIIRAGHARHLFGDALPVPLFTFNVRHAAVEGYLFEAAVNATFVKPFTRKAIKRVVLKR